LTPFCESQPANIVTSIRQHFSNKVKLVSGVAVMEFLFEQWMKMDLAYQTVCDVSQYRAVKWPRQQRQRDCPFLSLDLPMSAKFKPLMWRYLPTCVWRSPNILDC
jgi:hypothetical protein